MDWESFEAGFRLALAPWVVLVVAIIIKKAMSRV